jgi:hypothetical protein
VASVLMMAFVAAGCAQHGPATYAWPGADQAQRALRLWVTFPVDAVPRPLVLTGPSVIGPPTGFPDGDTKEAYLSGTLDLPTTFPRGPSNRDGFPLIDAKQAARLLIKGDKMQPARTRLSVTEVRLASAVFDTDRGPRRLPAWLYSLRRVADPVAVLAIAPSALFTPPREAARSSSIDASTVAQDPRTVIVRFIGGPSQGPCSADYAIDALESHTAVAVQIREVSRNSSADSSERCASEGHRTVTVRLVTPLGPRVLISADTAVAIPTLADASQ